MMDELDDKIFINSWSDITEEIAEWSARNGFWECDDEDLGLTWKGEYSEYLDNLLNHLVISDKLDLIHTEVSEVLEALRQGNPPDDKVPEFLSSEIECADIFIRLVDLCKHEHWRLPEAILAKHKYNLTRPYKNGKKY